MSIDADEWTAEGKRIDVPEIISKLQHIITDESALIVEHKFYRGGRAPHRFVCDDADSLESYVRKYGRPGDAFHFWRFEECCTDDNRCETGKIADANGRTPRGGAY